MFNLLSRRGAVERALPAGTRILNNRLQFWPGYDCDQEGIVKAVMPSGVRLSVQFNYGTWMGKPHGNYQVSAARPDGDLLYSTTAYGTGDVLSTLSDMAAKYGHILPSPAREQCPGLRVVDSW